MLKVAIFDMDETLIDSYTKLDADITRAFALCGETLTARELFLAHQNWEAYMVEKKCKGRICSEEEVARIKAQFWVAFNQRPTWAADIKTGVAKLFPETLKVLEQLKAKGYRLLLVSRSEKKETYEKVEGFGLGNYFTGVYVVPVRKERGQRSITKTYGYLQAIDQERLTGLFLAAATGTGEEATLFCIGDRPEDVFAGVALRRWAKRQYSKASVITILIDRKGRYSQERHADAIVKNLQQAMRIMEAV